MGPVELASCAFGQSSKISYLEMASAVCAVVNGGRLMQPYVVSDILGPEGEVIDHLSPVCKRQVLKEETSRTMREMMEAVVLYGGGRNAQIAGYRVGGKSGTSQKLDSADEKARIASFVAVAPIDDPQFLCLVCLDEPHSWTTAGGSLLCLPELPLIECFEYTLDRANGVEQISVQGSAIFASYHRRLRVDETFLLQLPHILCHRIFTHADRMTDGFVTGVALVGLPILAPEQIGIEGDLTKIQTDAEYLVWYHKIVFLCTALGPFVETQFIPPVLS